MIHNALNPRFREALAELLNSANYLINRVAGLESRRRNPDPKAASQRPRAQAL